MAGTKGSRMPRSTEAQPPRKIKVNLSLEASLRRRLGAYAAWIGRDESDVVADALVDVLRGFVVHQRSASSPASSAEPDHQAEPPNLLRVG